MSYRTALLISATLAGASGLAHAQSDGAPQDEIVVTATRVAEPLSEVPASVSLVTRPQFEAKAATYIGDELVGLPNIFVQRFDSGTYTALTIRGVPNKIHNDTFTALLDGVPMAMGDDEVDLEQLPYEAVGRVEVIRGTTSALYGSQAVAGTLSYLTRDPEPAGGEWARLRFGSFGLMALDGSVEIGLPGGGALGVWGTAEQADGWRDRTGHWTGSLFVKAVEPISDTAKLSVWIAQLNTEQHLAGDLPVDAHGSIVPLPRGDVSNFDEDGAGFKKAMTLGTAILDIDLADGLHTTTKIHARWADTLAKQAFYDGYDPASGIITFTGFQVHARTDTGFLEQEFDWTYGPNRLIFGGSAEYLHAHHIETWTGEFDDSAGLFYAERRLAATGAHINEANWISNHLLEADSEEIALATYVEDRLELWDRLTLTAGARYDHFRRRVDYGPTATGDGPIPSALTFDAHAAISPKASATLKLIEGLNAYISYGAGFSPGFGPIWSFRGRDTDLKPENADTVEIGLKTFRPDLGLSGSVDVFRLERHDLLELLIEQPSAVTVNAGGQQAEGVELEGNADLGRLEPGLSLGIGYGYVDSRWTENRFIDPNTGLPYDFSGKRVQGIPAHTGNLSLTKRWERDGVTVTGWIDFAGNYWYDNQNTIRGGAYALFNTSATWDPPVDGLELRLTIKNLLDRRTTLVTADNTGPLSAYPGLPRQIFGSVAMRF